MHLLTKLKEIYQYSRLMGMEWFLFRLTYELKKRRGYFEKKNSEIVQKVANADPSKFYYDHMSLVNPNYTPEKVDLAKANNALDSKIFSFSHEYLDYNIDGKMAWNYSPKTKVFASADQEWNTIPDFGELGDIKLVWEASRFPQVYFFIDAYAKSKEVKYAYACLEQIEGWIDANPYPLGVNYKCGQEITFRIFAWIVALEYFDDFIERRLEKKIVENIYVSLLRVDINIDYAAKSVKNNHSISEASGLLLGGLLFPQFEESKMFVDKGMKYLQKELAYQVYEDGSYIQSSFTYERLALDVLSFVILVCQKAGFALPQTVKEKHRLMMEFLNSMIQANGYLPNYGSNDGAYLFPVSEYGYRDFRPSLNFASVVNSGKILDQTSLSIVELFGCSYDGIGKLEKNTKFDDGGYYLLKNKDLFLFTRCHSYRDRPAQNDMLHLDVWYRGQNIFCDAGSFSYNTDKDFKNNFIGVPGHNTIMINNTNQMEQVLNFGWSNWTRSKLLVFSETGFEGEHYGYQNKFSIVHKRKILLDGSRVKVIDTIEGIQKQTDVKQIWNTLSDVIVIDEYSCKVDNCIVSSSVPYSIEKCYISEYYNSYKEGSRISFQATTDKNIIIETIMEFGS